VATIDMQIVPINQAPITTSAQRCFIVLQGSPAC